jgi:hypothetical protein
MALIRTSLLLLIMEEGEAKAQVLGEAQELQEALQEPLLVAVAMVVEAVVVLAEQVGQVELVLLLLSMSLPLLLLPPVNG